MKREKKILIMKRKHPAEYTKDDRSQAMWDRYPMKLTPAERERYFRQADLSEEEKKDIKNPSLMKKAFIKREEKQYQAWEKAREREFEILELRLEKGMTLEQIAATIIPTVTRERIRQILRRIETREGIKLPSYVSRRGGRKIISGDYVGVITKCAVCEKKVKVLAKRFKGEGQHVCIQHRPNRKYFNEDGTPMTKSEMQRYRYHNDPEWKTRRVAATKKWTDNAMKNNPDFRRKYYEYQLAYQKKKRGGVSVKRSGKNRMERIKEKLGPEEVARLKRMFGKGE